MRLLTEAREQCEHIPEQAGKLRVAKLNVDDSPHTAGRFGVPRIPTLILFSGGGGAGPGDRGAARAVSTSIIWLPTPHGWNGAVGMPWVRFRAGAWDGRPGSVG